MELWVGFSKFSLFSPYLYDGLLLVPDSGVRFLKFFFPLVAIQMRVPVLEPLVAVVLGGLFGKEGLALAQLSFFLKESEVVDGLEDQLLDFIVD